MHSVAGKQGRLYMRSILIFLILFSLPAAAQNASTGSNSESDYRTEDSSGVSRERAIDTSKSQRSETSQTKDKTESLERSKERSISTNESISQGEQLVTEYGIEPVKIMIDLIKEIELNAVNKDSDNPLVRQIAACSVFSDPCVPTLSFISDWDTYRRSGNQLIRLKQKHENGLGCNQYNPMYTCEGSGEWITHQSKSKDLLVRTSACYALVSYTAIEAMNRLGKKGKIEISANESFSKRARVALTNAIEEDMVGIMSRAMEFGDKMVGQVCRIPTRCGYQNGGNTEWFCGGFKVNAREATASYQGMSMIGGSDLLGNTYIVQRRIDSSYQVASEHSKTDRDSTAVTVGSTEAETSSKARENNVSMRRTASSEQSSTVTTGVSTRNDATAASQK